MKKVACLGWLIVFLPAMVFAQEKIEAPIWNTGDKWVFDREGPMEVTGSDGCGTSGYLSSFQGEYSPKVPLELPYSKGQPLILDI